MIGNLLTWFDVGRTSIIGRIQGTLSLVLMVGTFLKVWEEQLGIQIDLNFLIMFGIIITILNLGLGYVYCKVGLLEREQRVKYSMSPQVQKTYEAINRIEKQLKELKK